MESFASLHGCNLKLSGRENQDIRYLIHRCRRTTIAIGECPHSFLEEIAPLASEHPSIRTALLALSARLRNSSGDAASSGDVAHVHSSSGFEALNWHQETIIGVRTMLSRPHSEGIDLSCGDVTEVLGSCLLLVLFGFPEQAHNWSTHVTGMIAYIESLNEDLFCSVPLVRNAQTAAGYLDVLAFALNRPYSSQRKWLEWKISPLAGVDGHFSPSTHTAIESAEFTPFEVTSGYPQSLVTVIALVSAVVEDINRTGTVVDDSVACYIQDIHGKICGTERHGLNPLHGAPDAPGIEWTSRMHAIVVWWEAPAIPPHISTTLSLALTTAWEIMRKAAHIYLFRRGFATSIHIPRPSFQERAIRKFLREMIVGLQYLISLAEEQEITIANAMIWPMTVMGNEIFDDQQLQTELVALFQRLQRYFRIAHLQQVVELLTQLWQRYVDSSTVHTLEEPPTSLSLELLAAEKNLAVPLF